MTPRSLRATARRLFAVVAATSVVTLASATAAIGEPDDGTQPTGETIYPVVDLNAPVQDLTLPVQTLEFGTATMSGGVKEQGEEITLAGAVLFDPNKHTLSDEAAGELDQLVATLKEHGPQKLTVVGHTDDVQSAEHNQKLSERRAETIADALHDELGDDVTIEASGKGEAVPIADNDTEKGRTLNRRVVVTVVR